MKDAASIIEYIRGEDEAEAEKLRILLIPQRAGMVVGARLVAQDLSQYLPARLELLHREEIVAKRLEPAAKLLEAGARATLTEAAVDLVRDELTLIIERIRARGAEWMDGSLRLEGQLHALEQRVVRLDRLERSLAEEK